MQTITVETNIAQDGTLTISLPSGLPPGKVEVVLVIQPQPGTSHRISDIQQAQLGKSEKNTRSTRTNGKTAHAQATRFQQGKQITELLGIALKDVEWNEVEEGRRDRCF